LNKGLGRTLRTKLGDKLGPFRPENVCTGERTVTTAYNERINSFFDQVMGSRQTALDSSECS
jgi:hypothetical protein